MNNNEVKSKSEREILSNNQAGRDVIMRDITVNEINNYVQKNAIEFFKHTDLTRFESPYFPKIGRRNEIVKHILEHHILILGGSHSDKLDIAWHLAVYLRISMQSFRDCEVYECSLTSDSRELVTAIHKKSIDNQSTNQEVSKIFVLLNLKPQDVELDLLKKISTECKIFVIATTETPYEKWSFSQLDKKSWLDSSLLAYNVEDLCTSAIERLPKDFVINAQIKSEINKLVAKELSTVSSIDIFIDELRNCNPPISFDDLNIAIQSSKSDKKDRLKKWFRSLSPREQLLALGITLFNGLYADQFFAALERVVKNVWQMRDPSLQALDHCDLENLGNYCEFSEVVKSDDFVIRRLNVKDSEAGKLILEIGWESHRRQIITALQEIVRIIQDSTQENFNDLSDEQIYGHTTLQERLYEGVSKPFACVGLVTPEATSPIRDLLNSLASDSEFMSQNFAATVLAYWYQSDAGKLLRTLSFFYEFGVDKQSNQQEQNSFGRQDYRRATVALAISYASLNDLPNYLHLELCDWLTQLSNSKSALVREYFAYHTLVYVVPRHLIRISSIIKDIAEIHGDLSLAIAQSLVMSYENYPDQLLGYLKEWQKDRKKYSLICTVIRTYGLIDCSLHNGKLSPQAAFEQIKIFLRYGEHPSIRNAVIESMSDRLRRNCSIIAPLLMIETSQFTKSERDLLVTNLTEMYLTQRAHLKGGDGSYEVNDIRYRIWTDSKRPLTSIETSMLHWLGQNKNQTAQQIATQAAIEFAIKLDISEDTVLNQLKNSKVKTADQDAVWQRDISKPWHEYWLSPLVSWLATLQENAYQPVVQNILPETLIHHQSKRGALDFVLRKWTQSKNYSIGDDERLKLNSTATFLRRGLWIVDNKIPMTIFAMCVSYLGIMTVSMVGNQIVGLLPKNQDKPESKSNQLTTPSPLQSNTPESNQLTTPTTPSASPVQSNIFENTRFPQAVCGDPLPNDPRVYPLNLHPVYVDFGDANLQKVRSGYCQDSLPITRENGKQSIQVASFLTIDRANAFKDFMVKKVGSGEVGKPTFIQSKK